MFRASLLLTGSLLVACSDFVAAADQDVAQSAASTLWPGAVDAIDHKAKTFAMLVVGKGIPESGKVATLKLTDQTRFMWRTADPRMFVDAKAADVKRGQHVHVLKNEANEALEIRLPARKPGR